MRLALILVPLFCLMLRPLGAEPISGQVFIVTRGHESVKLGLVAIRVFDYDATVQKIAEVRKTTDAERKKVDRLVSMLTKLTELTSKATMESKNPDEQTFLIKLDSDAIMLRFKALYYQSYLNSGGPYLDQLPTPMVTTKTDADGNYSVDVPGGHVLAIGAAATRTLPSGETECYYWLVKVGDAPSRLTLSNDNLTSANSGDSLLVTGDESGLKSSMTILEKEAWGLRESLAAYAGKPIPQRHRIQTRNAPAPQPPHRLITLTKQVKVQVKYGDATLPAGSKLRFRSREGNDIIADYGSDIVRLPVAATDEKP